MRRRTVLPGLAALAFALTLASPPAYQESFDLEHGDWTTTGRNRFFVLEPGYRLVLEGKDGRREARLEITVLDETRTIGGVPTRVIEERETVGGELREVSRNFYAIDRRTGSVFYFGEEVDVYRAGKVVRHEGAWLHGERGASAGMMMPGDPKVGARYYEEHAPGVALDRAEVVDLDAALDTPAGILRGCLKVREENPVDGEREFKIYAPGIGLARDEDLLLAEHGFAKR